MARGDLGPHIWLQSPEHDQEGFEYLQDYFYCSTLGGLLGQVVMDEIAERPLPGSLMQPTDIAVTPLVEDSADALHFWMRAWVDPVKGPAGCYTTGTPVYTGFFLPIVRPEVPSPDAISPFDGEITDLVTDGETPRQYMMAANEARVLVATSLWQIFQDVPTAIDLRIS